MKKKKVKKINEKTVLFAVLIVLLILAVGSLFVIKPKISEFTIYEEVCENESYFVYEGRNFSKGNLMEEVQHTRIGRFMRYDNLGCDILEEHNVIESSMACVLLNEEIERLTEIADWMFADKRELPEGVEEKQEEVCEQVEVDDMRVEWFERCKLDDYGAYDDCEYCLEGEEDCKKTILILINKEDLTIEWLEENCECANHCDNPDFEGFNCKDTPCFLWNCNGYVVERVK